MSGIQSKKQDSSSREEPLIRSKSRDDQDTGIIGEFQNSYNKYVKRSNEKGEQCEQGEFQQRWKYKETTRNGRNEKCSLRKF